MAGFRGMARSLGVWLALGGTALLPSSAFAAGEDVSITTYYPSPGGAYKTVRLYPASSAPATCTSAMEGTMYYNSTDRRVMVCTSSGGTFSWQVSPGGGDIAGWVPYGTLYNYHTSVVAPIDTLEKMKATMAACNRRCSQGCAAGGSDCNGVQPGLGFHSGAATRWSSTNVKCVCF